MRRTKIVATVGPASDTPERLTALIAAGVDVFRISTSHDPLPDVLARIEAVRTAEQRSGRMVGVLVDLAGPKLRFTSFGDTGTTVAAGDEWQLRPGATFDAETRTIGATLPAQVWDRLVPGTRIAVGDGAVSMQVTRNADVGACVVVVSGGTLRGRPGLHVPSDIVDVRSPTADDLDAIPAVVAAGADMVAVSFVRTGADVSAAAEHADGALVIAKIETTGAVRNLAEVIDAAGAVMVARGDLGLEFPFEELPFLQKRIIAASIDAGRPVITATQMLESMVSNPTPTRAEATDVAAAVLDGTSAVMLSGETAIGAHPVAAVAAMSQIAARAEGALRPREIDSVPASTPKDSTASVTHAVSSSAWRIAEEVDAEAIVCITERGFTARTLARWRPPRRLLAVTSNMRVARQLKLSWGVTAVVAPDLDQDGALAALTAAGELNPGDRVVVVSGEPGSRATDSVRVRTVPTQA